MAEKSKKLSQEMRRQIRGKLLIPALNAEQAAKDAVCDAFFKLQVESLPEPVRPYVHTTYLRTTTYGSSIKVRPELANCYGRDFSINIGDKRFLLCPTSGTKAHVQTIYENNKETLEPLMFAQNQASEFVNTLDKKLSCMLNTLNTTAKLRDEFPEAYAVYLEISGEPEPEKVQTACDDVEELRALLTTVKTK